MAERISSGQSVVLRSSLCLNSFTNRMPSEYGEIPAAEKTQTSNKDHFHFSFALSMQEDQALFLVKNSWPVALDNFVPYSK